MEHSRPLTHKIEYHKLRDIINRSFTVVHSAAIALLIRHRYYQLCHETITKPISYLLVFASELLLAFNWLLDQAYRWRIISRNSQPENLPQDGEHLPGLDVFICTADPEKEPTVGVMGTVLSAMAMDYPADKLHVYLSDDSGAPVTLRGMQEAWKFAKSWIPFCNEYQVKTRCPEAFFAGSSDMLEENPAFLRDKKLIKEKYEIMKEGIRIAGDDMRSSDQRSTRFDHGAAIELRVSGVISNSPYFLVLDCDHYCNDPSSAKQAMCFHLDPDMSSSLAFVQFPQKFHNVSENDIYDSQLRIYFEIWYVEPHARGFWSLFKFRAKTDINPAAHEIQLLWHGIDGLNGPGISGTNFYMKRKCLYVPSVRQGIDFGEARASFGQSDELIKSLHPTDKPTTTASLSNLLQEAEVLASCKYEDGTEWGRKIGFLYNSVAEDFFTSLNLHCRGWTSVYTNPSRPQFLGTCITSLNDLLVQGTRWASGLLDVGLSRFCPLTHGPPRMSFLQSMCHAQFSLFPLLHCLSLWCLATVPQLCLLNGIPLYSAVSSPDFKLYSFVFISSTSKHLYEVLSTGGSSRIFINEIRAWMMKSVTCNSFGTLDAVMKKLKLREASFVPTNKIADSEQLARYHKGIFDFQAPAVLLLPLVALFILNLVSFVLGVSRAIVRGDSNKMFAQIFISFYALAMNHPVLEGMFLRKDQGRITPFVSIVSLGAACAFLILGSTLLA